MSYVPLPQAQLDELIANAKRALAEIQGVKEFKQVDWTGEQSLRNCSSGVLCGNCSKPLERDLLRVGRKSDYCSDACKMKAYRKRKKQLRNSLHSTEEKPLLAIVKKHPLQNLAPLVNPNQTYPQWKRPDLSHLSDDEIIALGYFIGEFGTVHNYPIPKVQVHIKQQSSIKNFSDLKSFFGG